MIKVLHLNGASGWGGNEQQLMDTIVSFPQNKVDNIVYCLSDSALSVAIAQVKVARVLFTKDVKYASRTNQKQLFALVKNENVDIIHIHTSNALTLFFFAFLFKSAPVKVVFSKKGMGSSMSFLSKIKYNFHKIDCIICVSDFVLDSMKEQVMFKRYISKLIVIPDGIHINRMLSCKHEVELHKNSKSIQILNIANHTQAKDLTVLIYAIDYLVHDLQFTDFYVHQLGEYTRLTADLKQLITLYKLDDFIQLYGFKQDAGTTYKKADIFVITSKKEGGPSSILEAMSQKIPVISTQVGIVPQVIRSGYNGISTPIKNHEEVAKGILKLAKDPALRLLYAERSFEIFSNDYTAEKAAAKTYQLYKNLLNNSL